MVEEEGTEMKKAELMEILGPVETALCLSVCYAMHITNTAHDGHQVGEFETELYAYQVAFPLC